MDDWATKRPNPKPFASAFLLGTGLLLILALVIAIGLSVPPTLTCTAAAAQAGPLAQQVTLLEVDFFNGQPSLGQNVGKVTGTLFTTTVDSLGWNGAPFSFVDKEMRASACAGPLVTVPPPQTTSDVCQGLDAKIRAADELLATKWEVPFTAIISLTALTDTCLALALILTALQLLAAAKGYHLADIVKDSTITSIPLVLVMFGFFVMLASSLAPPPSPAGVKAASLNPALINLFVNRWLRRAVVGSGAGHFRPQCSAQAACAPAPGGRRHRLRLLCGRHSAPHCLPCHNCASIAEVFATRPFYFYFTCSP